MKALFGFHMPNYTFKGTPDNALFGRVVEQARAAEAAGFDLVTVMDHFYQIRGIGRETEPMLEAYTTLSALAASRSPIQLIQLRKRCSREPEGAAASGIGQLSI